MLPSGKMLSVLYTDVLLLQSPLKKRDFSLFTNVLMTIWCVSPVSWLLVASTTAQLLLCMICDLDAGNRVN